MTLPLINKDNVCLHVSKRWYDSPLLKVNTCTQDYTLYLWPLILFHLFHLYSAPLSNEKAQQIIDQALNSSSLDMRNVVAVITGLMGSGKTWLLSRLFNQLPPDLYTSTGVAERSLRSLLHHMINISLSCWEPFTYDQILEFLACVFLETLRESNVVPLALEGKAVPSLPTSAPSPLLPLPSSSPVTEATSPPTAQSSPTTVPTSTAATESSTMQSMVSNVPLSPASQQ